MYEIDRVIFVPTGISPVKKDIAANGTDRLVMIKNAIEEINSFSVDDIEISEDKISYSIDTIKYFKKNFPNSNILLLIGYDNIYDFHTWKSYLEILDLCKIIVLGRNIAKKDSGINFITDYIKESIKDFLKSNNKSIHFATNKNIDISSSEIKKKLAADLLVDKLVCRKNIEFIKHRKLYGL